MEQIIMELTRNLTSQREQVVRELRDLNPNDAGYMTKEQNLKNLIFDIDSQISMHLTNFQNFNNQ